MIETRCQYCGESYSPSGLHSHEMWCEENPDRGTPHWPDSDNDNVEIEIPVALREYVE